RRWLNCCTCSRPMATPDEIRRMSDELARNPGSTVFMALGEALRRQGQTDLAMKVAQKGLERHRHIPEAHDLLARVHVDRKEFERAAEEWDKVLVIAPGHLGALKGLGFICYQRERFKDAERYLAAASANDPDDLELAAALVRVRAAQKAAKTAAEAALPTTLSEDSRFLFAHVLDEDGQA